MGLNAELIYQERLVLVADPAMIRADMLLDHRDAMSQNLAMAGEQERRSKGPALCQSVCHEGYFVHYVKKGHAIRPENRYSTPTVWHRPEIMIELSSCISAVQLAASGLECGHRASTGRGSAGEWSGSIVMILGNTGILECQRCLQRNHVSWPGRRYLIDLMKQKFNATIREASSAAPVPWQ